MLSAPVAPERIQYKEVTESISTIGQAVEVLGKCSIECAYPVSGVCCYTSLGDRALWERLEGMQPQQMRQRAFWISWFLKAYITGLMMEL